VLEQQRVQGVMEMDVGDVVVLGLEVVDVVVLVVLVVEEEVLGMLVVVEVLGVVEQVEVLVVVVVVEEVVEEVVVAVAVVVADADDDDDFSPVHLGHLPPVHPLLEDLRLHPLVPCVKRIYNDVYVCCYKIKNN